MAYTHLTDEQRRKIYQLKVEGLGVRAIAEQLGRDKGTISRELRRNRGERGYRPAQAARMAHQRLHTPRGGKQVQPCVWEAVKGFLAQQISPEQAAKRLKSLGPGRISHETIYQRIHHDKAAGGTLHTHLPSSRKRRKRYESGPN